VADRPPHFVIEEGTLPMVTAELGACEWFVWDLRRSNLVERGKLEQVIGDYLAQFPAAEPADLANYLVEQRVVTRFQADCLLGGKSQGLVLGPFVLMDALGQGSMGTVYRAQSKLKGDWYAVKVLPRRSMWNIRIARRKVRDFEQFKHPAVVPFVDVGTAGSTHYLAWPYVEGHTLSNLLETRLQLPPQETAYYIMQVAEGLEACHQRGILHGLLKPSNLMIDNDGQVKVLDFGIGALLGETDNESVVDTMSTANTMASGLDFASPESIMDPTKLCTSSDQYSLGCVMYNCLTGRVPFPGSNAVEKMMAHQTKDPTPINELDPGVPQEYIDVVTRLMQKEPKDRFPSVTDVIVALRPLASKFAPTVAPKPPPMATPAPVPPRAKPVGQPPAAPNHVLPPSSKPASGKSYTLPTPDRRAFDQAMQPTPTSLPRDTVAMAPKSGVAETRATHPAAPPQATSGPKPSRPPQNLPAFRQQFQRPKGDGEERMNSLSIIIGVGILSCVIGVILTWVLGW
jgi:serine/threonine-protein kinase